MKLKASQPAATPAAVAEVVLRRQSGLLDGVLHPRCAEDQTVYLSFTKATVEQLGGVDRCDTRLGPFCKKDDYVFKGLAIVQARLVGNKLSDAKMIWRAVLKTMGRNRFGGAWPLRLIENCL